jgi:hypothetical protein
LWATCSFHFLRARLAGTLGAVAAPLGSRRVACRLAASRSIPTLHQSQPDQKHQLRTNVCSMLVRSENFAGHRTCNAVRIRARWPSMQPRPLCGTRQSRGPPRCIAGQANAKHSQQSSPTQRKYKQLLLLMAACSIISVLDWLVGSLGAAARCKLAHVVRLAALRGGGGGPNTPIMHKVMFAACAGKQHRSFRDTILAMPSAR